MERRPVQERRRDGQYRHPFYRHAALDIRAGREGGAAPFVAGVFGRLFAVEGCPRQVFSERQRRPSPFAER